MHVMHVLYNVLGCRQKVRDAFAAAFVRHSMDIKEYVSEVQNELLSRLFQRFVLSARHRSAHVRGIS